MHRRAVLVLPLLAAPLAARAQAFPTRAITILVPFVAGGPSDIVARAIAARMQQQVGQPVVAENRPGANGAVAARALARAAPDGYTIMVGSIGVYAINQALRPDVGYDAIADFTPITLAVTTPNVLVVNPSVPARTVAEFTAWLRQPATRASYATSGVGSSDHLTMELFKLRTGTDITHVPYGGGAAATTDLIAGNVQASFQNLGTVAPQIAAGRLRALGVTAEQRSPVIADVPTMIEAGVPEFVVTSWQAVMGPGNLPEPLAARLHAEVTAALRDADTTARLGQIGLTVVANSRAEYAAFQRAEVARWREVIQRAGITPG
jgi:tripartite-type tricarboxylate transporter receptor subunit TctC